MTVRPVLAWRLEHVMAVSLSVMARNPFGLFHPDIHAARNVNSSPPIVPRSVFDAAAVAASVEVDGAAVADAVAAVAIDGTVATVGGDGVPHAVKPVIATRIVRARRCMFVEAFRLIKEIRNRLDDTRSTDRPVESVSWLPHPQALELCVPPAPTLGERRDMSRPGAVRIHPVDRRRRGLTPVDGPSIDRPTRKKAHLLTAPLPGDSDAGGTFSATV